MSRTKSTPPRSLKTQTINIELPPLYRKQHAALFDVARYSFIEGSTKSGKTHGCIIWQIFQVFSRPGVHWWVAPVYAQAKIAYKRAKKYLPSELYTANDAELEIRIAGAAWQFKSGEKSDNLYGEDVQSAVIDEASRMREESWLAIRSTLTATRGPIRIIGNVKGRGNWFYKLCRRGESGAPNYAYHKITAQDAVDAGILSRGELEDARQAFKGREAFFRELYFCEPADDGGNPFGIAALAACVAPMSRAPTVVWGWDLAKSVDWTVGVGLDADGVVSAIERWQRLPWDVTLERILKRTTGFAMIDSTGVGDPIVEGLQRRSRAKIEGFKFTSTSKQQLMEGLATDIGQGDTRFPDGVLRQELEDFEYQYTRTGVRYEAPSGLHDDCVCAFALARHAYKMRFQTRRRRRLKFTRA